MRGLTLAFAAFLFAAAPALAQEGTVDAPVAEAAPPKLSAAEMRADSLDRLFASLYMDKSGIEARRSEQKIWDLWMSSDSPTAEVLLRQAATAMDEGAPEQSLTILNRLIGAYPGFAEAWNRRATLYFLMKNDDESLADIEKVLELEPRHFGALAGRGMIFERKKNYAAALEAYEEALRLNPGMSQVKDAIKKLEKLERGI